jgi:hypothetical protein
MSHADQNSPHPDQPMGTADPRTLSDDQLSGVSEEQRLASGEPRSASDEQRVGTGDVDPAAGLGSRREYRDRRDEQGDGAVQESAMQESAMQESATTDHDVIRRWADDRHATPATLAGTEHDGDVGELRFDLELGNDLEDLTHISWDDWFAEFDQRGLQFVFHEGTRPDGSNSNDFHFEQSSQSRG